MLFLRCWNWAGDWTYITSWFCCHHLKLHQLLIHAARLYCGNFCYEIQLQLPKHFGELFMLGDVSGCLQASICIMCVRRFIQPCPMDLTSERVRSIFCFFSKFLSQNCNSENSDAQVKFSDKSVVQAVICNHRGLTDYCEITQDSREAVGSVRACQKGSGSQKRQRPNDSASFILTLFKMPCFSMIYLCYFAVLQNTVADSCPLYAASPWFLPSNPKKVYYLFFLYDPAIAHG